MERGFLQQGVAAAVDDFFSAAQRCVLKAIGRHLERAISGRRRGMAFNRRTGLPKMIRSGVYCMRW